MEIQQKSAQVVTNPNSKQNLHTSAHVLVTVRLSGSRNRSTRWQMDMLRSIQPLTSEHSNASMTGSARQPKFRSPMEASGPSGFLAFWPSFHPKFPRRSRPIPLHPEAWAWACLRLSESDGCTEGTACESCSSEGPRSVRRSS